ncbi:MAG: TonB-dependent receptor [Kofleriaceae bacterium]|nr:TonB-dependent receptor [Kofleriaceae bacterium]
MRRFALVASVLGLASVAHADDPRDVFGLPPKKQTKPESEDVRDVFGFGKKQGQEKVDCSDGTGFPCAGSTDPLDEHASPYSLVAWLSGPYLLSLPVADATHDQVANYALGATRDEAGVVIGGANGLENRWTIEGAPADNVRTGAVGTRVPLAFLKGMRVTVGGFTARDRVSTGGMIDAELVDGTDDHQVEARAFATWFANRRQRKIAPGSYFVRRGTVDDGPGGSFSVVATGPIGDLAGGTLKYVAGVAPELSATEFRFRSATITDRDNDGMPDGLPGVVSTEGIDQIDKTPLTYFAPWLARLQWSRGAHSLDLSFVGEASNDVFFLFNSTLQAAGVTARNFVGDGIATWRGTWTNTRARAQLAWHRQMRHEFATDPAAENIPQLLSAYVPTTLPDDPLLAERCSDDNPATDRFPNVPNCPVPVSWFFSGGAGQLSDVTGDRPSVTADIAQRIGNHVLRAGGTAEDTRLVTETHFTGGVQIRSLFPTHMQERRFADPAQICHPDVGESCPTVDEFVTRHRTRYAAAYVEDTWQASDDIAVDGGVRWELMWVGPVLHFSNEWAPRLGASWDPLGKGRSRVWVSMGRTYAMLPAGLGSTIISRPKTVDRIVSQFGEGRSVDQGAVIAVASDVKPIAQDELTAGAQFAVAETVLITTWLQGVWLRRGLDTTTHGFDNPGRYGGTPALRETGIFATEVATAPTAKTVLRIGYMYGQTIGSWTGAFDPRQGAVLYAGSDYDASSVNQLGILPTDIGHRVYVEAQRTGHIGGVPLTVSTRLTAGSGRPRSVIGDSDEGIIFLIPRGTAGRGPVTSQANVRLASRWRGLDITLDLFNVFDRRDPTNVDEIYAGGIIRPIDHGESTDLVFLKTESGAAAVRRPTYGSATAFQAPFAAALGIHRSF